MCRPTGTHECTTHQACVIVLCHLCFILLHHTGKAARIGGGAGQVMTLGDGWSPATEIRTTPWINHSPAQLRLILSYVGDTVIQRAAAADDTPAVTQTQVEQHEA